MGTPYVCNKAAISGQVSSIGYISVQLKNNPLKFLLLETSQAFKPVLDTSRYSNAGYMETIKEESGVLPASIKELNTVLFFGKVSFSTRLP